MIYVAIVIYLLGLCYGLLAFYWAGIMWNGPEWKPTCRQVVTGLGLALIWPVMALYEVLDRWLGR